MVSQHIANMLGVHTVGGVISPGELILLIVPVTDDLTVEARVAPQDIDQLTPGQSATLRLSAFSQRTTPELNGTVSKISADLSVDERSGAGFYTVHVVFAAYGTHQAQRIDARAWSADRDVLFNQQPHHAFLSGQASRGSDPEGVSGGMKGYRLGEQVRSARDGRDFELKDQLWDHTERYGKISDFGSRKSQ